MPHDHCLAIQHIGDKLEWISNNIRYNGASWTCAQQQSVEWFCKEFGKIKFEGLKKNFLRILNGIAELEEFGYLDWIGL